MPSLVTFFHCIFYDKQRSDHRIHGCYLYKHVGAKDSSRLVFALGIIEIVRGVKKDFAYADKERRKKKVTMLITAVLCVSTF